MDDVAQMKADLGHIHRDAVSAPGSRELITDANIFEQRDEQRRQRAHNQAIADAGNMQHAKISAWNTQENFGGDPMVDGLTNRFSGQGHRDQLNEMNLQQRPQSDQARVQAQGGRGRPAPGNGARGNTAAANSSQATARARQAGPALPKGLPTPPPASSTASSMANAPANIAPVTRPSAAHRIQAPARLAQVNPTPATPGTPIRVPRAAATSALTSSVRITGPQDTVRTSATVASPRQNSTNASSPATGSRSSATTTATIVRVLRTEAAASPKRIAVPVDHYRNVAYVKMAEYYALNPGPQADKYYEMFPERLPYLAKARAALGLNTTQKVEEVAEDKIVEENVRQDAVVGGATATEPISKKTVEKAAPAVAKEIIENGSKVEISQDLTEQQPCKADQPEPASSVDTSSGSIATATSESTALSVPSPAGPSTAKLPMYGKLVVTYLDHESNHLGTHNININAPIQASIQLTSKAELYDPRALDENIRTLAKALCLQDQSIRLERGEDGLWQEVSEDDDL